MAVIRVNKNKNYTIMSNYHFKDKNMSLKAKGLLSMMLSLPDNWNYSVEGLVAISKESKTVIQSTLKELEDLKYLKRTRVQNSKGQFEYIYDIYEKPQTENPYMDNMPLLNTKELNTNNINNKKNKKETEFDSLIKNNFENEELKQTVYEFIKMRKAIKKPLTTRGLELMINKLKKITSNTNEQIQILNNSIMNNWLGIFPLKEEEKQKEKVEYVINEMTEEEYFARMQNRRN